MKNGYFHPYIPLWPRRLSSMKQICSTIAILAWQYIKSVNSIKFAALILPSHTFTDETKWTMNIYMLQKCYGIHYRNSIEHWKYWLACLLYVQDNVGLKPAPVTCYVIGLRHKIGCPLYQCLCWARNRATTLYSTLWTLSLYHLINQPLWTWITCMRGLHLLYSPFVKISPFI